MCVVGHNKGLNVILKIVGLARVCVELLSEFLESSLMYKFKKKTLHSRKVDFKSNFILCNKKNPKIDMVTKLIKKVEEIIPLIRNQFTP